MANGQISLKRIGVDKANTRIVIITAVAAFIVIFCAVACVALVNQLMYQNRVIGVKKTAVTQLQDNIKNTDSLVASYKAFVSTPQNILGGDPGGKQPNDGTNAKITLDALPSKYDFPALASSLEKVAAEQGVSLKSITGTDDEVAQESNKTSSTPTPLEVPFAMTFNGSYDNLKKMVSALERSIRPFQVMKTDMSGDQNDLSMTVTAKTFYQPEKSLNIQMKVVK